MYDAQYNNYLIISNDLGEIIFKSVQNILVLLYIPKAHDLNKRSIICFFFSTFTIFYVPIGPTNKTTQVLKLQSPSNPILLVYFEKNSNLQIFFVGKKKSR